MKKKLIGPHNLDQFIQEDKGVLCLGPGHILSPGARDAARNRGISIVYSNSVQADTALECSTPQACAPESEGKQTTEELSRQIVTLLKTEFNLSDPEMIRDVTVQVLNRLQNN